MRAPGVKLSLSTCRLHGHYPAVGARHCPFELPSSSHQNSSSDFSPRFSAFFCSIRLRRLSSLLSSRSSFSYDCRNLFLLNFPLELEVHSVLWVNEDLLNRIGSIRPWRGFWIFLYSFSVRERGNFQNFSAQNVFCEDP